MRDRITVTPLSVGTAHNAKSVAERPRFCNKKRGEENEKDILNRLIIV
jgi:hypothetical protein